MASVSALLIPLILAATGLYAAGKGVDVYSALGAGAKDGLGILLRIFPNLVALLTAVAMLRASGALDLLAQALAPALGCLGIPPETLPLMLVRPFSGSGALGVGAELIQTYGPDSTIGRTAAVMLGAHRDHLLHRGGLLRGGGGQKKPVRHSGGPDGRCHRVSGGRLVGAAAVRELRRKQTKPPCRFR